MSSSLTISSTFDLLNTKHKLPILGFGVWDSPKYLTVTSCKRALEVGYRHIDTAQCYANEAEVGKAVRESGIPRKDVYITSKILHTGSSVEETCESLVDSVKKVDGDDGYIDLMLIHNPGDDKEERKMLWQALEKCKEEGTLRDIGVSNFGIGHIEQMRQYAKVWPPAINQIELHPWAQQREIVDYCHKNKIIVEAYCPLVRNQKAQDRTLNSIAEKHGKTTQQVLLRYCLQKRWSPLPKSDNADRIAQNADLYGFDMDDEDMKKLDDCDEGAKGALVMVVDNSEVK